MLHLLLALLVSEPAFAHSNGQTGSSVSGCGGACHSGGSAPTVALTAPATTVSAGSNTTITFRVTSTSASQTGAGLDVSATGGTFTAGTGTKVSSGEITHTTTAVADAAGAVAWTFTWTAPSTAGTYTLKAAGNSVNRNGSHLGDLGALTQLVMTVTAPCVDADIDGVTTCAGDCNDGNPGIRPGAPETCDGVDQDCDSVVDEDATDKSTWYRDADSDTYGALATTTTACVKPAGYVANSRDCNDASAAIKPGATELCDAVDQDCDGLTDEDASDALVRYADVDGDGYGSAEDSVRSCVTPAGYVANRDDCDDADADVSPGAVEVCDAADVDEDCDDLADDDDPDSVGGRLFYVDGDGDGHGGAASELRCDGGAGWALENDDCDDSNPREHLCAAGDDTDMGDTDVGDTDVGDTDVGDTDLGDSDTGTGGDTEIGYDTDISTDAPGDSDGGAAVGGDSDGAAESDAAAADSDAGTAGEVGCGCDAAAAPSAPVGFAVALAMLLARRRRREAATAGMHTAG